MLKRREDYFYLGGWLLFISIILYFIKLYMANRGDKYIGTTLNANYIEIILWSIFFALIGFQSIIIGSLKKTST